MPQMQHLLWLDKITAQLKTEGEKKIEIKYPVNKIALKNILNSVTKTLPDIQCKYMQIPTVFKSFHLNTRHYFLVNIMQPIWQNKKSERKQNPTFKLNMCKKKKKNGLNFSLYNLSHY